MNLAAIAIASALTFAATAGIVALADTAEPVVSLSPTVAERYDAQQRLIFPSEYRMWRFLSSGVDMSYSPMAMGGGHFFDNVFVDPKAYDDFFKTGHWPDGTVLITEVRGGETKGSITQKGVFQSGQPMGWEVHVKDSARFGGDGWGFFGFEQPTTAALIPATAACYACHREHAAVDTTFVQFYPTLLPIAEKAGTISGAYAKELQSLQHAH
ncbi:MAG: cytochrome P460 family protein [Caulobacterales bacterium]